MAITAAPAQIIIKVSSKIRVGELELLREEIKLNEYLTYIERERQKSKGPQRSQSRRLSLLFFLSVLKGKRTYLSLERIALSSLTRVSHIGSVRRIGSSSITYSGTRTC